MSTSFSICTQFSLSLLNFYFRGLHCLNLSPTLNFRDMEETQLYRLIKKATKESILKAFRVAKKLDEDAIKLRSEEDRSTYLHHIVNAASDVYKRYEVNLLFIDIDQQNCAVFSCNSFPLLIN